jgi:nucleotide-binding universal stress UspA family protein
MVKEAGPRDAASPVTQSSGAQRVCPPAPYIVLVGLDLSEPGGRAWRFAFELAALRGENSEVHAVVMGARAMAPALRDVATLGVSTPHREEAPERPLPLLKVFQHRSAGGQAKLMAMHFRTGRPDRAIVCLAKEIGADVIVVATPPPTRWQRLLGSSVADRITRNAPCPVVLVKPKTDENDPGYAEFEPRAER